MILVDTSIWIDHLHRSEPMLVDALRALQVAQHPMIVGELALGSLRERALFLNQINLLPQIQVANHEEVMTLVDAKGLHGRGLNLVDAHLAASVLLSPGTRLWTRDKRLHRVAGELGISHSNQ